MNEQMNSLHYLDQCFLIAFLKPVAPPNIAFSCADPITSLGHGAVHFLALKRQYLHYNTFCFSAFLLACAMAPSLMFSPVNTLKYTRTFRRITDLDKNPQRMLKVWVI